VPKFAPADGSAALRFVDARASAAGLRRGDILVAINGRPYTGDLLLFEALRSARPGESLAVTVRSPDAGGAEHTVYLPVAQATLWSAGQILFTVTVIQAPDPLLGRDHFAGAGVLVWPGVLRDWLAPCSRLAGAIVGFM